jgi:hypothetical protein
MFTFLTAFVALSFYVYGISCLVSARMSVEFERYGLAKFRALTGVLQLAGALGLTLGLFGLVPVGFLAATGLSLQMALGVIVRLRIRDSLLQCFPAFFYFCLSGYVAFLFYGV